jgi:hypothetical protein
MSAPKRREDKNKYNLPWPALLAAALGGLGVADDFLCKVLTILQVGKAKRKISDKCRGFAERSERPLVM